MTDSNGNQYIGNKIIQVNKNSSPQARLAVMRAQQIIGIYDQKKYEEIRQEVIKSLHPKTKELWLELEKNYDCEVCELSYEGQGVYSIKIRLPSKTYIGQYFKHDIFKLVKPFIYKKMSEKRKKLIEELDDRHFNSEKISSEKLKEIMNR